MRNGATTNAMTRLTIQAVRSSGAPQVDADADGMADSWESAHGLNPANGADHSTVRACGWTAIEEYVNELADGLVGILFRDGFESSDLCAWS